MEKMGVLVLVATVFLCLGPASLVEADFLCRSDGIYAKGDDCTSYYECQAGKASVHQCSKLLHFNPILGVCDWPRNGGCVEGEYDDVQYAPAMPVSPEMAPADLRCDCWGCPIRDPYNCSCYYKCNGGYPTHHCCAPGLVFNPSTKTCDYPHLVPECPIYTTPSTTTTTPSTTTTTPSTTTTTPSTTTPNPTCPPCPCVEGSRTPIPGNCSCYLECCDGEEKVVCCPEGLHYDPISKICDVPKDPACITIPCPCSCCFVPDYCDCQYYWRCLDGIKTRLKCGGTLVFDPERNTCDWPHNVNRVCPPEPPFTTTTHTPPTTTPHGSVVTDKGICWKGDGHYPHKDCRKFYHCSHDIPYVKDCPDPLHFSVAADRCEWPSIANCIPSGGP